MPYPNINTNSKNNTCCKMRTSKHKRAGVDRVMFIGNPRSTLDNKYNYGTGVGPGRGTPSGCIPHHSLPLDSSQHSLF